MFIDARKITEDAVQDRVCIIGAGAAGITLALELEDRGIPVTVLESGGMEREAVNQDLARGDITGRIYFALDNSRLRYFGGCTNHWAGLCRPMDTIDFENRAHIPESGWPFGRETLTPYYERARYYLGLDRFPDVDRPGTAATFPDKGDREFELDYEQFSPLVRMGDRFRKRIERSKLIKVYLYANVTEFATNENSRLNSVTARTLPEFGGRALNVSADRFVLATGGIENARILLLTERNHRVGLGNRHENVGRYFMEHLHAIGGILALRTADFPYAAYRRANRRQGFLRLRDELQNELGLLNCRMILEEAGEIDAGPLSSSVFDVSARMDDARNANDTRLMHVKFISEQAPTRESYVGLSDQLDPDPLGQARAALHWKVSDLDKRTIDANLWALARAMGREGHGRLQIRAGSRAAWKWNFLAGGNHHMGTTRMSTDPKRGVVDADCRLFDIENFYVAGSSVFPNTGHANPTYTVVAMAVRLAEHLGRESAAVTLSGQRGTTSRT